MGLRRCPGGGWELVVASPLTVVNELPLPLSLALSGSGSAMAAAGGTAVENRYAPLSTAAAAALVAAAPLRVDLGPGARRLLDSAAAEAPEAVAEVGPDPLPGVGELVPEPHEPERVEAVHHGHRVVEPRARPTSAHGEDIVLPPRVVVIFLPREAHRPADL